MASQRLRGWGEGRGEPPRGDPPAWRTERDCSARVPPRSGLCEFPSGTDLRAFGSKLKHECWEEGGREEPVQNTFCLQYWWQRVFKAFRLQGRAVSGPLPSLFTKWKVVLSCPCVPLKPSIRWLRDHISPSENVVFFWWWCCSMHKLDKRVGSLTPNVF